MDDLEKNEVFDTIGFLLLRLGRAHRYLIRNEMQAFGLFRGQPPVLFALNKKDGMSNSEMAEFLEITPATLTNKVKRMEKANLVIRKRDPEDERVSRIFLTEKGKGLINELHQSMQEIEEILLKGFSGSEEQRLKGDLLKIIENIEAHYPIIY